MLLFLLQTSSPCPVVPLWPRSTTSKCIIHGSTMILKSDSFKAICVALRYSLAPTHHTNVFTWPPSFLSLLPPSCSSHHAPPRSPHASLRVLQATAINSLAALPLPRPLFQSAVQWALLLLCFFFPIFLFSLCFATLSVFVACLLCELLSHNSLVF